MAGKKNLADTFFWNDWENDPELKTCSLAAQGLWMRCLCVAARSPEPGFVLVKGQPSGRQDLPGVLARLVGQPPETLAPLLDELIASETASVDRKGRVYCRRMVRAAAVSQKRSESGRNGAYVTNGNKRENEGLPRQNERQIPGNNGGKPPGKMPASSILRSSNLPSTPPPSPEPRPTQPTEAERWGVAVRSAMLEFWPDDMRVSMMHMGRTEQWRGDGYDLEKDVLPAIRNACADKRDGSPSVLKYFDGPIRRRHAERLAASSDVPPAELVARLAAQRLRAWNDHGDWEPHWGPRPTKRPIDKLSEAA